MAAVLASSTDPPVQSPSPSQPQSQSQSQTHLQPGVTSPPPGPVTGTSANNSTNKRASQRRSLMSTRSHGSRSRPTSNVFPLFPSSLSYALVRDFAYPHFHPLHYGPAPEISNRSSDASPFSSSRRLSDPPPSWDGRAGTWSAGPWGGDGGAYYHQGDRLPSTSFDDDPSDDEAATSGKLTKNHRKSKSYAEGFPRGRNPVKRSSRNQVPGLDSQGFFKAGADDDDDDDDEDDDAGDDQEHTNGAGGGTLPAHRYAQSPARMGHDLGAYHQGRLTALEPPFSDSSDPSDIAGGPLHHLHDGHEHRPTSISLDESFAGPSLALYNFEPENSNELPLREGQIIQVGYRHGQGWLVAMDMESGEQGLVPEEYVRLLSEIEGWGDHLEGMEEDNTELREFMESQQQQRRDGSMSATSTERGDDVKTVRGGSTSTTTETELAHRAKEG